MKITTLKISKLHGFFDYEVKFNEDITFIYGENGSGKTTVLNILDNIVSGEIYKLFKYDFEKIQVYYKKIEIEEENEGKEDENKEGEIIVCLSEEDLEKSRQLTISFDGQKEVIDFDRLHRREMGYDGRNRMEKSNFFSNYKVSEKIRNTFNYVFLPLNRLSYQNRMIDYREARLIRNKFYHDPDSLNSSFSNESMSIVENIIYHSIATINSEINGLNDDFKQKILKSALEMKGDVYSEELFEEYKVVSNLEEIKSQYIKLLEEFKTITSEEQKQLYIGYFDDLIGKVKESLKEGAHSNERPPEALIGTFVELIRISELIHIFEEMNKEIEKLKLPIDEFLQYSNLFLNNGTDNKTLEIDTRGNIRFTTNYTSNKLKLKYLSSGEKQIVTLFANLIFKVNREKFTIFIVDEPELSLHLSWQKKLVETIQKINPMMQLVFATHSPEIVGRYDDKVFELRKKYDKVDNKSNSSEDN